MSAFGTPERQYSSLNCRLLQPAAPPVAPLPRQSALVSSHRPARTGRPLRAGARGLPGGPGTGFAVRCSARATACPGRNRLRGLQTYGPEERGEDARAGVRRRIRFGCESFGEPPEGGECAPCRRPKAGSKAADEREQGKERDAEAGRSGRPDRRRRPSRRRQEEAAGGRFRARAAAIRSNPPPSIRSVQRGCPPTAPRRTAEAQHAASVRAQAARPSAAPCQARRPAGRGV